MLSLWKLRVGVEAYYLAQIARGLDEYYTGAGEAPGRWIATGSPTLGLSGAVIADDLRAVLAGLAPGTGFTPNGTQLVSHARRVPGFDLTFSVPKSVSVVYALGDPLVQAQVVEACEVAVDAAVGWLEREASFVRRGTNNRAVAARDDTEFGTRRMIAKGLVAASFPHRTSRLGDPHLHWHVLVANMAEGIDGRWTALDGTAIYRAQRTIGALFQTTIRQELSARLGVEWGPTHREAAEIAGIPARVLREFSQRTERIAEWMDTRGVEGIDAKKTALLATRTTKDDLADLTTLTGQWRDRAARLGWGPEQLDQLLATSTRPAPASDERFEVTDTTWHRSDPTTVDRQVGFDEWLERLLVDQVTATDATFTRHDLTRAIAGALPADADITSAEQLTHRALASPAVVPVGDHWRQARPVAAPGRVIADDRELRYTAASLVAVECRFLDQIGASVHGGIGVLRAGAVEQVIVESSLGPDQAAAVRTVTSSGSGVGVLVGRAGTGKTHTLGTIRTAYETAGWTVIGLAPSARAARELEDGAGIDSATIARHLVEQRSVTSSTLVVIDEAGMAATRDLAAIIDQATRAEAKVLLVGDHHQLPEVAPGGAFRAVIDALTPLGAVAELTVNRRQVNLWEQDALDQLRHGDVIAAFNAYRDHGRVVIADQPEDIHAIAIADWAATRPTGSTLLLAGTRAEARVLNRHARTTLHSAGLLDLDHEIEIGPRSYTVGDEVVLLRNHRHQTNLATGAPYAVDNGTRGTITGITPGHDIDLRLTNGDHIRIGDDYVERGWVAHGYALTIHKAQGVTCDHVLVVGPAGLYREGAYVALSRARHTARLYATIEQAAGLDERHQAGIALPTEPDHTPEADLAARLEHSAAKTLVTIDDPDVAAVDQLARNTPVPTLLTLARHAAGVEESIGLPDPATTIVESERAVEFRRHAAEGRRVRSIDRDNVGHLVTIDDTAQAATVRFENDRGHTATRVLPWSQLVVIDNPAPINLGPAAAGAIDRLQTVAARSVHEWASRLAEHGLQPGDATHYRRALHLAVDRAAHDLHATRPEWLTTWIGQRPTTATASVVWDDTVNRIARHRAVDAIPAGVDGLGPRPESDPGTWDQTMLRTLEDRLWLTTHPQPAMSPLRQRTPAELAERRTELAALLASAPDDQTALVERLVRSQLDPTELHELLATATHAQDDRRRWIITNWPHLVELEQINTLIAIQPALAAWPAARPPEIDDYLRQLAALAIPPAVREERTLAQIDRAEADADPVRRIETQLTELRQRRTVATTPERLALDARAAVLNQHLHESRRRRTVDRAFAGHRRCEFAAARANRLTTATHDALTRHPDWLVEDVTERHAAGALPSHQDFATSPALVQLVHAADGVRPSMPAAPVPQLIAPLP